MKADNSLRELHEKYRLIYQTENNWYEQNCQSYKAPYANYIANYMNIEDYREYCLSLGEDMEEKQPFQNFKNGEEFLRILK